MYSNKVRFMWIYTYVYKRPIEIESNTCVYIYICIYLYCWGCDGVEGSFECFCKLESTEVWVVRLAYHLWKSFSAQQTLKTFLVLYNSPSSPASPLVHCFFGSGWSFFSGVSLGLFVVSFAIGVLTFLGAINKIQLHVYTYIYICVYVRIYL